MVGSSARAMFTSSPPKHASADRNHTPSLRRAHAGCDAAAQVTTSHICDWERRARAAEARVRDLERDLEALRLVYLGATDVARKEALQEAARALMAMS